VWIGDLEPGGGRTNVLCALHADSLSVPVGWQRCDVRETPRLFAVPSTGSTPPRPRRATRRSRTVPAVPAMAVAPAVPAPRFDAAMPPADTVTSACADRGVSPTLGELHRVGTELSAATAALLHTTGDTPLLARAFRTSRAAG